METPNKPIRSLSKAEEFTSEPTKQDSSLDKVDNDAQPRYTASACKLHTGAGHPYFALFIARTARHSASVHFVCGVHKICRRCMDEGIPAQVGRSCSSWQNPRQLAFFAGPSFHYLMWLTSRKPSNKSAISHRQSGPVLR